MVQVDAVETPQTHKVADMNRLLSLSRRQLLGGVAASALWPVAARQAAATDEPVPFSREMVIELARQRS